MNSIRNIDIKELISSKFTEPTFYVNFYKIGRPSPNKNSNLTHQIQKSNNLLCWKIENKQLRKIEKEHNGILFDCESYIVQWFFDLKIDNSLLEELLVYNWKGQHALKGYTPLPPELEEHCPVERIVQWSEPALFFQSFQNTIVFSGKENEFDSSVPHLLLVRGEVLEEIHSYEVPCKKKNLRSKANFLLVIPKEKSFLYWHGSQTSLEQRQKVVSQRQPHNYLRKWQQSWTDFSVEELEENKETSIFLDTLQGSYSDFIHIKLKTNFSPKLFYLNSITGSFIATQVEYPLRAHNNVAPFPFVQSHLYTAPQPALFLLDNNTEIWLWEGIKDTDGDNVAFNEELKLAIDLQKKYAQEKEKLTAQTMICFHIHAHKEPDEFKNIFPLWVE